MILLFKFELLRILRKNLQLQEETHLILNNLSETIISKDNEGVRCINEQGIKMLALLAQGEQVDQKKLLNLKVFDAHSRQNQESQVKYSLEDFFEMDNESLQKTPFCFTSDDRNQVFFDFSKVSVNKKDSVL